MHSKYDSNLPDIHFYTWKLENFQLNFIRHLWTTAEETMGKRVEVHYYSILSGMVYLSYQAVVFWPGCLYRQELLYGVVLDHTK